MSLLLFFFSGHDRELSRDRYEVAFLDYEISYRVKRLAGHGPFEIPELFLGHLMSGDLGLLQFIVFSHLNL
jgi:hypothetical protein